MFNFNIWCTIKKCFMFISVVFYFFHRTQVKRIVWDFPQWKVIIFNQFQSQIVVIFLIFQQSHWTEVTCLSYLIAFYQVTTNHVPEIHSSSKDRKIGNISQFFQPRHIKV